MTSFEATNSVFKTTNEKKVFRLQRHPIGFPEEAKETIIEIREFLGLRAQKDIELHVEEVRKRGNQTKRRDNENILSELDTRTNEITKEIKNEQYNGLKTRFLE